MPPVATAVFCSIPLSSHEPQEGIQRVRDEDQNMPSLGKSSNGNVKRVFKSKVNKDCLPLMIGWVVVCLADCSVEDIKRLQYHESCFVRTFTQAPLHCMQSGWHSTNDHLTVTETDQTCVTNVSRQPPGLWLARMCFGGCSLAKGQFFTNCSEIIHALGVGSAIIPQNSIWIG